MSSTELEEILHGNRLPPSGKYFAVVDMTGEVIEKDYSPRPLDGRMIMTRAGSVANPLHSNHEMTITVALWPSQELAGWLIKLPRTVHDAVSSVCVANLVPVGPVMTVNLFRDQREADPELWQKRCRYFVETDHETIIDLIREEHAIYRLNLTEGEAN
jgi:hypothetical protein